MIIYSYTLHTRWNLETTLIWFNRWMDKLVLHTMECYSTIKNSDLHYWSIVQHRQSPKPVSIVACCMTQHGKLIGGLYKFKKKRMEEKEQEILYQKASHEGGGRSSSYVLSLMVVT